VAWLCFSFRRACSKVVDLAGGRGMAVSAERWLAEVPENTEPLDPSNEATRCVPGGAACAGSETAVAARMAATMVAAQATVRFPMFFLPTVMDHWWIGSA
jgi:hypothetical protein